MRYEGLGFVQERVLLGIPLLVSEELLLLVITKF